MRNRLFIVGSIGFPRGTAGANYDQYVALALKHIGWEVIIIGTGKNRECDKINGKYVYKGIEYYNEPQNLKVKYGVSLKFYKEMDIRYTFSKMDYYIIRDFGWLPQYWLGRKVGTDHMQFVHFEDLKPSQYRMAYINPKYWSNIVKWHYKQHYLKKSLPISELLENQDKRYGCKTLRLPIMADPDEFGESVKKCKPDVISFIYPGAKLNGCEDNIKLMLNSFRQLDDSEKKRVKLNITGTSMEKLKIVLQDEEGLLEDLENVLVIHQWLEYEELIDLYRQMDFLILVRFSNPVTLANFPSKVPETLSFGIIPVCTRVGEYTTNYLFDGENSIVFEPESCQACQDAIKKAVNISNDEYLRLRRAARKTAIEKFGYKQWSEGLNDFILD